MEGGDQEEAGLALETTCSMAASVTYCGQGCEGKTQNQGTQIGADLLRGGIRNSLDVGLERLVETLGLWKRNTT